MKYYVLGLGLVGQSFLNILKDKGKFNPNTFYCVEEDKNKLNDFLKLGGKRANFKNIKIEQDNLLSVLNELKEGDYLFDFTTNVKSLTILEYCLNHNIHYLFTADSSWVNDKSWISIHQHFLEYKKLREKYGHKGVTSVIEFGMNPGLVSLFMKEAIKEIINKDNSLYVRLFRNKLKQLIKDNKYNLVAKKLKITLIEEIDIDNQKFSIERNLDTIYSPWNAKAFYYESISSPEIAYDNVKNCLKHDAYYDIDIKDQYIALRASGIKYQEETVYSKGRITANVICHEEIFSMREYLTYKKYRPTVIFLYHPSNLALTSVNDNFHNKHPNYKLLTKKDYVSGGEEVGILIQGKRFKSRYFANYLDSKELNELATIRQVSAGVYGAYQYIKNHPNEGFLFPEELNEEVLACAKEYLKSFISIEINNKVMLNNI
ncbi:MAG: saccharopine dehydrogenase NADP-binding domain-containing protein [Bacilli bacterium]|nr:saccharopine dehydrogenase NADP-binding domain-containing protein [Bacilli bacterium]